ncbi:ABC transporter permease [Furfurilactobacillus rossiae]|uniref:Peptide ABC superfamily ATP binding cassette transporter, ABC protein n=1 Tax=Furfurilactobacillus rossiae DSM 15814 TaxID=1114972 RepID=A0A0R1RC26_9LACO|nr:ABC transporter permease [Furfurilactobacillus rossiae]KRL52740.1 peptide ABC superfamily ATP binding cassette transporter, ABC protein [Furfurilactobacillus rossiae DSM 15814]QFR66674.1 ABC transporter permease subunit [Furfurilactobacillus rossiae]QLE62149.1 Oligopeptide transport system permease protein OppC [Furfurilactobacillus rossiae]
MAQNDNLEKKSSISAEDLARLSKEAEEEATPSSRKIIWNEFKADKAAMTSVIIIVAFILFVVIASFFIPAHDYKEVNIMSYFNKPFTPDFWLGADSSGRSIAKLLIVGSRNSIGIAIGLTFISGAFGIAYGLISGYFGGITDMIMSRIYDFMIMLPQLMFIIVLVTIIQNYNAVTLTLILSLFQWMGTSRLIRSRSLAESRKDYVAASKTSGTGNFRIIFREIMPNISSLIIVEMTLSFAANLGVETGLSFLGFGLPNGTPSLGTLMANATDPTNITQYWWTWIFAAIEIIVLCLAVSYVGQALRRAADSSQRLGME